MDLADVSPGRISYREGKAQRPGDVVYWMQQSQRVWRNPAFELSKRLAVTKAKPLWVLFALMADAPEANSRHYRFMIQGLFECAQTLRELSIGMFLGVGAPADILGKLQDKISILVMDKGYLNWQRDLRRDVKASLPAHEIYEVEADVHVPVEVTSSKEEYAAATLRPKILKILPYDLVCADDCMDSSGLTHTSDLSIPGLINLAKIPSESELWKLTIEAIQPDESVSPGHFEGGYRQAGKRLDLFLNDRIHGYSEARNHPGLRHFSDLSPYLHFGQISAQEISQRALDHFDLSPEDMSALIKSKGAFNPAAKDLAGFLEELIVRRELSCNYCHFNHAYDEFQSLPAWAKTTLYDHWADPRPRDYSLDRLENAETDDPYWNLAQREMLMTGKMNNYMRMYWGKKLIEWLPDPELSFRLMLWLNNKYELDGRDPNAYAGVAWCFGKHDRPWQNRPVFGSVRYMNKAGLDRKFDMSLYAQMIEDL